MKKDLTLIPGIGRSMEKDLHMLGIFYIKDLINKDPQQLYDKLCEITKTKQDRCVLYVFRCAVYFAEGGKNPEKLKWWNWKD